MIQVNLHGLDGSTERVAVDAVPSYRSRYRVRPEKGWVWVDLEGGIGLILTPDEAEQMATSLDVAAGIASEKEWEGGMS